MKKFYALLVCLCLMPTLYAQVLPHKVAVIYVVPADVTHNQAALDKIKHMTAEMQNWYQLQTGGRTFEILYPDTAETYLAQHPRQYYIDNGNWWNSLIPEMQASGLVPVWTPGYITAIWVHGGGWVALGAQWCGKDCGVALLGVELLPQFNNPLYTGGVCPGGTGASSWPCTPQGAYFHELGHTFGLPHPVEVPATNAVADHSVMQTHWNYPNAAPPHQSPWGLLSLERQTLAQNPFLKTHIEPVQFIEEADVVNLPVTGAVPQTAFTYTQNGNEVHFKNKSSGATSYYWTFGDSGVSNLPDPSHIFRKPGTYKVTLRANSPQEMMGIASALVTVNQSRQVQSFTLVNAVTEQDIMTITNGAVIDLQKIGVRKINIRANTSSPAVVKFKLRGAEKENRLDDVAPYALKGDDRKGNYYSWEPENGHYTLSATPHAGTKKHLGAPIGPAYTIHFRITRSKPQPLLALKQEEAGQDLALPNRLAPYKQTNPNTFPTSEFNNNPAQYLDSSPAYYRMNLDAKSRQICEKIVARTSEEIAGVSEQEALSQRKAVLYPNPTPNGLLQLQLPAQVKGPLYFTLYTAVGSTLAQGPLDLKQHSRLLTLDFSSQLQAAGIYYLRLNGADTYLLFKIIKE